MNARQFGDERNISWPAAVEGGKRTLAFNSGQEEIHVNLCHNVVELRFGLDDTEHAGVALPVPSMATRLLQRSWDAPWPPTASDPPISPAPCWKDGTHSVYRAALGLRAALDGRSDIELVADGVALRHDLNRRLPPGVLGAVAVDTLPTDLSGLHLASDPRCTQLVEEVRDRMGRLYDIVANVWPGSSWRDKVAYGLTGTHIIPRRT